LATQQAAGKQKAGQKKGKAKKQRKPTPADVLRHPLRIRILEVLNERDMSPIEFMNRGLGEDAEISQAALSTISYHFRELERFGCLELLDKIPRRGAFEHLYRGTARAYFTDKEWERLTQKERCLISRTMYSGLAARVERAMTEHTFDSRIDRHLTWLAMELDEEGWTELVGRMAGWYGEVIEIRHDAAGRNAEKLKEGKGSEHAAIPVTFGMLGFESPPLPPLDDRAESPGSFWTATTE
jgi:hypothetical protein